jgi:hypothetical protein
MFIELCFYFMSVFAYFYPHVVSCLSLCPVSSLSCAILSQAGLLEVPATYLGSLVIFLLGVRCCRMTVPQKKLMLHGGFIVCSLLSLVLYPKHVYFAFLTLMTEYWRSGRRMPLNKAITIT